MSYMDQAMNIPKLYNTRNVNTRDFENNTNINSLYYNAYNQKKKKFNSLPDTI